MNVHNLPAFLTMILFLFLGIFVYTENKKNILNKIFFACCLAFTVWSFCNFMIYQSKDISSALFWTKTNYIAFPFVIATWMHFILYLCIKTKKVINIIIFFFYFIAFCLCITYFVFIKYDSFLVKQTSWGYVHAPENYDKSVIILIINFLAIFIVIVSLVICFIYFLRLKDKKEKKRIQFILIGFSIPVFTGTFTSMILPSINSSATEYISFFYPLSFFLMMLFVGYAIWKYELFVLDPSTAAENIISIMPDILILFNTEGEIININNSAVNLLEYKENELINTKIDKLFKNSDEFRGLHKRILNGEKINNYEIKFCTKSGKEIGMSIGGSRINTKTGEIPGAIIVAHDDTERILREKLLQEKTDMLNTINKELLEEKNNVEKAKSEIEKKNIKLRELDKLKNDFIANITHELRTPLTLILGPVESILSGDYGDYISHKDENLKMILYNGSKLLKLINNLLDYAKIESGRITLKKQKLNISKLLNFYVSTVKSSAKNRGLNIIYNDNNTEGKLITYIDRDLFEKAIFNLISNSLKFTPAGGQIIVQLDRGEKNFSISIKDNGAGIPEDKLERIFERFHQLDSSASRKYEGTGIGLTLTKEIVNTLGGEISVKSKINYGSTFTITLPYIKANDDNIEIENEKEESQVWKEFKIDYIPLINSDNIPEKSTDEILKKKILVVEDNPDMQKYIKSILVKEYIVILAKNGNEGLEKIINEKPNLVLADIMMPDMDGYEMTKRIKKDPELKNIPIILLTAKADKLMKLEGFKIGANDYIIKPFDAQELYARINVQLKMKDLQDRLLSRKEELQKLLEEKISMQKLLEQNERRLSEMIDCLPVAIVEEDLNEKITYINQYAKKLLKINGVDSLNDIKLSDYIEKEERSDFINRIKKLNKENSLDLNKYKLMLRTGEKLTVIIKSIPYYKLNKLIGIRFTIIEILPNFNLMLLSNKNFYQKYNITEREKEVLIYLLQGYRNKDIGEKMFLSVAAVKKHISNIYLKTDVINKSELLNLITKNI